MVPATDRVWIACQRADEVLLCARRQPVRTRWHHRHLQGPDPRRAEDPPGHRGRARGTSRGRNCLVLTNWTAHLDTLASALLALGHEPVILRGMGARDRAAAVARLRPQPGAAPLLVVATGPYAGRGSTAPRWTSCSWPRPSRRRDGSSSTPAASCARARARPPPRSTTTTTSSPASSPHLSPSAHPATRASDSPAPDSPA